MPKNPVIKRRNLPLLMLQAREAVFSRFRPLLNEAGITEQQWRVIRALLEQGPLEPRQIGEICCLTSPSLAGILARMDDLGLVRRERLPHDQRRVLVSVSPAGEALAKRLAPRVESAYKAFEDAVGAELAVELYALLDKLIATLGTEGTPADGEE